MADHSTNESRQTGLRHFALLALCLLAVLLVPFHRSLDPGQVLFCNDGPYGAQAAAFNQPPGTLTGSWIDLNMLGLAQPSASPKFTFFLHWFLGALGYSKFACPLSLFFAGIAAWLFFRALKFNRWVCLLGGVASALNGNIFSTACWGLSQWAVARGFVFLALAALVGGWSGRAWLKAGLAGFCIGLGVMEGFDVGALYSVLVGIFAFFVGWLVTGATGTGTGARVFNGVGRGAVVALFAVWMAAHILISLVQTQVTGIAGTGQDEESKAKRWDFATQWSLPKKEAVRLLVPGLFGYRMDTGGGGNYWGFVGQDPALEKNPTASGFYRYSGSGEYAGVLVVLAGLWALGQSFRKRKPVFTDTEKKLVWFWAIAGFVALLFAFGRHAPFYQILYQLPFFSTIRNPIKFTYLVHVALLVLFGFGLQAMFRQYVEAAQPQTGSLGERFGRWWQQASVGDRRTAAGLLGFFGFSVVGVLIYAASKPALIKFLQGVGFPEPTEAAAIARFSTMEALLFLVFLALSLAGLALLVSGMFSGRRAVYGASFLGLILAVDMIRANQPWVIYYDYQERLATNPVIDFLKEKPYEYRVTSLFLPLNQQAAQVQGPMQALYTKEWLEHLFPFYNIQTLDIAQIPRIPEEYQKLRETFAKTELQPRYWELTSTRYLVALSGLIDSLNRDLDKGKNRFSIHTRFDWAIKPGRRDAIQADDLTIEVTTNGQLALVEFAGALPRARLCSQWELSANDEATLKRLTDPAFDPGQTALLAELPSGLTAATNAASATNAGQVSITDYSPKRIKLSANASAPAILVYNDRYTTDWKVRVDGNPATLLRCNYIMRGVHLPPGQHTVEFSFEPPHKGLYFSLSAIAAGALILVLLLLGRAPAEPKSPAKPVGKPAQ